MDAIWIPTEPTWGAERNQGGPKASKSVTNVIYRI